MVDVHNIVGTAVVVAYLALAVVNALRMGGRSFSWVRGLSFAAAALLLVQYVIGFWLLGDGYRNATSHYLFALLAIITVGLEHGYAQTRLTPRSRATWAVIATALTFVLVLTAHVIGSSSS